MGARGPVPKRSIERAGHRAKASKPQATKMTGPVRVPAASRDWHDVPKRWYRALRDSGQSRFFEPSDWAEAWATAELWHRELNRVKVIENPVTHEVAVFPVPASAEMMKVIAASMSKLGTTESDRRRMRIEVERSTGTERPRDEDGIAVLDDFRAALAG